MLVKLREHAARRREIAGRIVVLDREWDMNRAMETGVSLVALVGIGLAVLLHPWWLAMTGVGLLFLLQYAAQGRCLPATGLRRLGYRTRAEIDREKYALKAMRGDFEAVPLSADRATRALDAVKK